MPNNMLAPEKIKKYTARDFKRDVNRRLANVKQHMPRLWRAEFLEKHKIYDNKRNLLHMDAVFYGRTVDTHLISMWEEMYLPNEEK